MIRELFVDTPRYTGTELMDRLKFFVGIVLALTLFGIVFVVLYSLIFVTQPLTLFVIDHPLHNNYGHIFFSHVFQSLGLPIDYDILNVSERCSSIVYDGLDHGDHNVPYSIDCIKLDNFLCDFKARL